MYILSAGLKPKRNTVILNSPFKEKKTALGHSGSLICQVNLVSSNLLHSSLKSFGGSETVSLDTDVIYLFAWMVM